MISPEPARRFAPAVTFVAEHWKVGTIASELAAHPDAYRHVIESEGFKNSKLAGSIHRRKP